MRNRIVFSCMLAVALLLGCNSQDQPLQPSAGEKAISSLDELYLSPGGYYSFAWTDADNGVYGGFEVISQPTNVAGAYWRGDEKNAMLQRIYGTAWDSKAELDEYLWRLEEAKKRDHRKLGKELDMYSVSEDVGAGLILWHPKGAMIRVLVEDFSRQSHLNNGYEWVFSPHIGRAHLWETSGHLGFYKENKYSPMDIDGEDYYAKPMNCPFLIQIFRSHMRSYRDLPRRYAEYGTVYRYERSGVLHGLARAGHDPCCLGHPSSVGTS